MHFRTNVTDQSNQAMTQNLDICTMENWHQQPVKFIPTNWQPNKREAEQQLNLFLTVCLFVLNLPFFFHSGKTKHFLVNDERAP